MQTWNRLPRILLVISLLIVLCAGMFAPRVEQVEARPLELPATDLVISEIQFHGSSGANDEFVELFNPTGSTINLNGWELRRSNASGTPNNHYAFLTDIFLQPGQHYLIAHTTYVGVSPDATYNTGITDDGGIALLRPDDSIADQVGLSIGSAYLEGTPQLPLSSDVDRGYLRVSNGCSDTNDNLTDFTLINPSDPQNSSVPALPCLFVTDVNSSKPDATYSSGEIIDIDITFSNNVNVTGSPSLLLETGLIDRNAVYVPGSDGDATITFRYTVLDADSSLDLDYVSTFALSLNSGTITGAVGAALLDLPAPGTAGSLGANKSIRISAVGNPSVVSIRREDPPAMRTNEDSLVFLISFSEAVENVNADDFVVNGVATPTVVLNQVSGNIYELTISGGDIGNLNGVVGVDISPSISILDLSGNPVPATPEPATDETYTVDNTAPSVISINQAATQADPTSAQPVLFTIEFSEEIDASTFSGADITQNGGTATGVAWSVSTTANPRIYNLLATATVSGTLIPQILAGSFTDLAENDNLVFSNGMCAAPEPNNCVTLNVTGNPSVTINQANGQVDSTNVLPVYFTIQFSEPINTATFTTGDITQTGTATGVTWNISNSGNNMTFTLSAVGTTGYGTIIPIMAANRVTDLLGNNNTASTATDNSVSYILAPTATPTNTRSVVINEIAWAGTSSTLIDDEWIELYNPGTVPIDITDWVLRATDGAPLITLDGVIPAGGYFLLERDDDITVSDIAADQIYTGALSNNGEILTLYDASNKAVDTANGNGGSWPRGSSTTFGTMERITNTADSDSAWVTNTGSPRNGKNANGGDILGTPKNKNTVGPTPTPGKTPTPTRTLLPPTIAIDPRPIINEVLPRPGYDWNGDGRVDVFDEFIEIKNLTAIDINLKGWRLDDEANLGSNPYTLPDIILRPGERVVLFGLETNILLSDGGDTVRLINPNGKIYDAYTYAIAKAEDRSICRLPDGNPGSNSWFDDCIPTPKLSNTREGSVPVSPGGNAESPVCDLPDTIPADFFFAECRGYGAGIWSPFFWDSTGWMDKLFLPSSTSKWKSFVE